ncbi:MAG: PEP-CTERM sorting domain-containing protein [Planctomycetes bacterium]|nr:PEP-CTERM sorting domain-containing protein [Planctomycetota bacterium]
MLGNDASGADGTWNKGTGNWVWQDAANWSASPPPGVGDTAQFNRIDWARPVAIDMKGSSYNFLKIQGNYNGSVEIFYDSDFLTPNANPLGTNSSVSTLENFSYAGYGSLVEAANASPTLTVEDLSMNKEHLPVFYMPLVITDELWPTEHGSMYFYGDVTAGRITETRNDGWGTRVNFKSDLTVDSLFNPHRGDASVQIINVDGSAIVDTYTGEGATANFNDLHITTELSQANESIINIAGRYSGTATYVRNADVAGETRTPSFNLLGTATLAPGDSIGTLGSLALTVNTDGGTYEWEVGASPSSSTPGVGWDLAMADTFDLNGTPTIQIVESDLTESISTTDQFVVMAANNIDIGGLTGIAYSLVPDQATWDISGAQLDLVPGNPNFSGLDTLVLTGISAQFGSDVPEPSTFALAALGLLGLAWYGRRRKR